MQPISPRTALAGAVLLSGVTGALWSLRAGDLCAEWRLRQTLAAPAKEPAGCFSTDMVSDLPAAVRQYLLHVIEPGTPLADSVSLEMDGEMRLGARQPWLPLEAHQLLAPPRGLIWEASVGRGIMWFKGADSYERERGRTVFRLWDLLPIVRAGGRDVDRSARGRLAAESIWCPASLLPQRGVTWAEIDERTAQATVTIDGEPIPLTLTLSPMGTLQSVTLERWGNLTDDGSYALIPFGADILEEQRFDGYTVPSRLNVSWWYGSHRELCFFRARLQRASFSPARAYRC